MGTSADIAMLNESIYVTLLSRNKDLDGILTVPDPFIPFSQRNDQVHMYHSTTYLYLTFFHLHMIRGSSVFAATSTITITLDMFAVWGTTCFIHLMQCI